MEKKVTISENQQVTQVDFNNFGDYPRDSLDHLVADLGPGWGYTGFACSTSAPTVVVIANGRLYSPSGEVFYDDTGGGFQINFQANLPGVSRRIATIVAWGQEVDTLTQPRAFKSDASTGATESRVTSTLSARHANLSAIFGTEGPDPQNPVIPSNYVAIAYVTLNTTGVESIVADDVNRVRGLASQRAELEQLEAWRITVGARLDTLATELANLAARLGNLAPLDLTLRAIGDLARLKEKADVPDAYASYAADYFLDDVESDTGHVDYLARIEEGLRFPKAAERIADLELVNPIDDKVIVTSNFMLPKYHEVRRLANVAPASITTVPVVLPVWSTLILRRIWLLGCIYRALVRVVVGNVVVGYQSVATPPGSVNLSQFSVQTISWVKLGRVRYRWRWGAVYYVTSRINFYWSLRYDPVLLTFRRIGESFVALPGPPYLRLVPMPGRFSWRYDYVRARYFWIDRIVDNVYWDRVVTNSGVNGSVVAQTFLNDQNGWLTGLHLFFTQRGVAGDITLLICETTEQGQPNVNAVLATSTLAVADINIWPNPSRVDFEPTLLMQGRRYAIIPITSGAHFAATTERNALTSGTLFYSTDQIWFQGLGDMTRDLAFELIFAEFEANRVEVQLEGAQLENGIAAIDINADAQVPEGTSLSFEAQIGGVWTPLADPGPDGTAPLLGLSALIPIRAVFQGTLSLMPGFSLGNSSEIYTWRPRSDFKHISEERPQPGAVVSVISTLRLEAWRGAPHHTCTVKLLHGAGFTTVVTATAVADSIAPDDDGALIRKVTFSGLPSITNFKLQIEGTTDNVLTPFHVAERDDYALS